MCAARQGGGALAQHVQLYYTGFTMDDTAPSSNIFLLHPLSDKSMARYYFAGARWVSAQVVETVVLRDHTPHWHF